MSARDQWRAWGAVVVAVVAVCAAVLLTLGADLAAGLELQDWLRAVKQ